MTVKSSGDSQYFDAQKPVFMGMIIIRKGAGGEGELSSPSPLLFDYHYQYEFVRDFLSINPI